MNTKLMCLALASLVGATALNAQDNATKTMQDEPARNVVFAKDSAWDHTFIEVGNNITRNYGGYNRGTLNWSDHLNYLIPTIGFGKWYNPYFATRIQFMGGEMKDYSFGEAAKPMGHIGYHQFAVGRFDAMFDVVNYFSPYRENRFLHIIPFIGIGVGYNWTSTIAGVSTNEHRWTATGHLGVQVKMRLSKRVDFNLEAQGYGHDFRLPSLKFRGSDRMARRSVAVLGAGLTFHLGKKEFTPIVPEDPALMKGLNDKLNALRAENAELAKRPAKCPDPEPIQYKDPITVGSVVYFRLNSAKVDANQMINIHNIAQYAKNNTETITLVGYADRQTGTPKYNYALSERRAKAVAKILIEKYGISADRIKTSWEGDRKQPYAENVWNRVVIMDAE